MPSLVTNVLVGDIGGNCAAYEKVSEGGIDEWENEGGLCPLFVPIDPIT